MGSAILSFITGHEGVLIAVVLSVAALAYKALQKGDAEALVRLESLPLFKAHPVAVAVLERANVIAMGMLKTAYDVASKDTGGASAFNPALGTKIANDVLAQLKSEFGFTNVAAAANAVGGEAALAAHVESSAKVFITAPSGRTIVAPAPA